MMKTRRITRAIVHALRRHGIRHTIFDEPLRDGVAPSVAIMVGWHTIIIDGTRVWIDRTRVRSIQELIDVVSVDAVA